MPLLTQCPPPHGGVMPSLSDLGTSRVHHPASILTGQCRRYQPLNLLPCLVIIILTVIVIFYGLTHSHKHSYPETVPAPVCPQPQGLLLPLFSTVASYPQPTTSMMVFSGSSQFLSHLIHSLHSSLVHWGFVDPRCNGMCWFCWAGPSLSHHLLPRTGLGERGHKRHFTEDLEGVSEGETVLFYSQKAAAGQLMLLIHWSSRPCEAAAKQAAPPAFARSLPSAPLSAENRSY